MNFITEPARSPRTKTFDGFHIYEMILLSDSNDIIKQIHLIF